MANFVRAKSPAWSFGEQLTSTQANQLDSDHVKTANFSEGSAHTPTGNIHVTDGSGGAFGNIDVLGTCNLKGTTNATGTTNLKVTHITENSDVTSGKNFTFLGTTNLPKLGTRLYAYPQSLEDVREQLNATNWELFNTVAYGTILRQTAISTALIVKGVSRLPKGSWITQIKLTLDGIGAGIGHGALPASLPEFTLQKRDITTGTPTNVATATDASANLAAYEQFHTLTMTLSDHDADVDEDTSYKVLIKGETGANAVPNALAVIDLQVLCTCEQISP